MTNEEKLIEKHKRLREIEEQRRRSKLNLQTLILDGKVDIQIVGYRSTEVTNIYGQTLTLKKPRIRYKYN